MLAYSLVLQLFALRNYELISTDFESPLQAFVSFLEEGQDSIIKESKLLADSLAGKIPVIYSVTGNEGIAIRLRQQLNENSKMLCWHAVIPEMNHNESVGWENGTDQMAVVILRNHSDYSRNQARIEINKEIIHPKSPNIYEVWSKGDSKLEQTLYHIHFGDWLSYHLSEINQVDIMAIDAIDRLKSELSQLD
jgi:glucose/mannose-6-phosphate isomerase